MSNLIKNFNKNDKNDDDDDDCIVMFEVPGVRALTKAEDKVLAITREIQNTIFSRQNLTAEQLDVLFLALNELTYSV